MSHDDDEPPYARVCLFLKGRRLHFRPEICSTSKNRPSTSECALVDHPVFFEILLKAYRPITVLTGALGSGKSTLLSYIFSAQHGKKIAVIVNEFGDTSDIESRSMQLADSGALYDEVLELKVHRIHIFSMMSTLIKRQNGCLCCSFKDLGTTAIEKLMQRKGDFDHVLLETTGLADPIPILQNFWQDDELSRDLYLDALISLVDCKNFDRQWEAQDEPARRQIACADVLLLSKTDLVPPTAVQLVEDSLQQVNAAASRHVVKRGNIDLSLILGLDAYAAGSKTFRSMQSLESVTSDAKHGGITTLTIPLPILDGVSIFEQLIQKLLWEGRIGPTQTKLDIVRTKALLHDQQGRSYVLQGVQDVFEIKAVTPAMEIPPKLVLIGKHLNEHVRTAFLAVLAQRG